MENWIYNCNHSNCLSLKNRFNQSDFCFHDSGRFQAEKFTVNSDIHSLENIQDVKSDSFDKLHPVSHNKGFGFLSHEVEEIFPTLVSKDGSSPSIDYNGLLTICIKELQNLKKKVAELEGVSTPCSVISADITLDTVYLNKALLGSTGTNAIFAGPTGGIAPDVIPEPSYGGPTGTTSNDTI